jgi:hypothetical protein
LVQVVPVPQVLLALLDPLDPVVLRGCPVPLVSVSAYRRRSPNPKLPPLQPRKRFLRPRKLPLRRRLFLRRSYKLVTHILHTYLIVTDTYVEFNFIKIFVKNIWERKPLKLKR